MKRYQVELDVPSGSRVVGFMRWLTKLLGDHRMVVRKVTCVETNESMEFTPEDQLDKD